MNRLFLIDAYAMIYRAYYAFMKVERRTSSGLNTGVIYGFLNTLNEILDKENPTHIGVVFDPSGKTFRHEAYEQYKAQREQTPEDIRRGLPYIKRLLDSFRIVRLEVQGYEADDVIGTLAYRLADADTDVFMVTPDKDYGQLVGDHRYMYRPRHTGGFEVMDAASIVEKWGIQETSQIIDLLALMGDASDNIPGCPGVGEKTAVKMLSEYGSVDDLLSHATDLKGAVGQKVRDNVEQIRFSYFLATIKTDVPLDDACTLDFFARQQPDVESLTQLYGELEFRRALEKLQGVAPSSRSVSRPAATNAPSLFDGPLPVAPTPSVEENKTYDTIENVEHDYQIVDTDAAIERLCALLNASSEFCFDTETTSTDALHAELVGMSFAIRAHQAFYVPCPADRDETLRRVNMLKSAFENGNVDKVGQNMKYDIHVLRNYGVKVSGRFFDTMIAHYLLNPELYHNMDYMAETLLNYSPVRIESLIGEKGKGKEQKNMRDVAVEAVAPYAAEDADITLQLKAVLEEKLNQEEGATYLMRQIEMPLIEVLATMERNGAIVDIFTLTASADQMKARMAAIEREVRARYPINISSPRQVGELLFGTLHLVEKPRKTRTGQYVTDEETLSALAGKHPIVDRILEYRGLRKLLSTYIEALPKMIDPKTGRVHTSYNQATTATGRLSSSNPNLQNIPVRDDEGKEVRKAFVAERGCVYLSADYSQVELRIMAHLSGDEHLREAFVRGTDIHVVTASKIFNVPLDAVTQDMRRKAKTANFGIIYGISAFGLAERLGISRMEAKQLIDGYFVSFPGVAAYIERSKQSARERGYVETIFHRRRYLPDILSQNATVRSFAERNAVNAPIQGSAADIIKLAMISVYRKMMELGLKSEMILQVHDELNFSVPTDELDTMRQLVKECMENAVSLSVPLLVDVGVGNNWLEAH